jgi:hypothetical protein
MKEGESRETYIIQCERRGSGVDMPSVTESSRSPRAFVGTVPKLNDRSYTILYVKSSCSKALFQQISISLARCTQTESEYP